MIIAEESTVQTGKGNKTGEGYGYDEDGRMRSVRGKCMNRGIKKGQRRKVISRDTLR